MTVSNVSTGVWRVTDIRSIVESQVIVGVAIVIAAQSMRQSVVVVWNLNND